MNNKQQIHVPIGAALAVLLLGGSLAEAQTSQPAKPARNGFTGVWRHAGNADEDKQRRKVIEAATEDLSFFVRGTARDRLTERTKPAPEVKLVVDDQHIELAGKEKTISLRFGAKPITIKKDGKEGKLSARRDGKRIVISSQGEKGRRDTTYTLSPDGKKLTVSVRMIGERLSAPLAFRTTYRR